MTKGDLILLIYNQYHSGLLLSRNVITKEPFDCNLNVNVIPFYLEISIEEGKPIKKGIHCKNHKDTCNLIQVLNQVFYRCLYFY